MSIHIQPVLVPGSQEIFSHVITEDEVSMFAKLVGMQLPGETIAGEESDDAVSISKLLMVGIIGGLLKTRFSKLGSQCTNLHFEFLSPIHCGDRIETTITMANPDLGKHLATFNVDCYNQTKDQVITGQAVMIVPH